MGKTFVETGDGSTWLVCRQSKPTIILRTSLAFISWGTPQNYHNVLEYEGSDVVYNATVFGIISCDAEFLVKLRFKGFNSERSRNAGEAKCKCPKVINPRCPMDDKESFYVRQKCKYHPWNILKKGEVLYNSLTSNE